MRQTLFAAAAAIALLGGCATGSTGSAASAPRASEAIAAAVAAPTRTPANIARDRYRHPAETLAFFGVRPTDTVVELWPGGGWYTEILAPLMQGGGTLYAAGPMPNGVKGVQTLQAKDPATYGAVRVAAFPPPAAAGSHPTVPDGSADVVLTFRNVHNWRFGGIDQAQSAFAAIFRMLKPGGTLGVVEHRLPEDRPAAAEEKSGYLKTSSVVALARNAGFELVDQSEINANPRDTADWPEGVWTLPPNYRLKDVDRAKYEAIGESDRMTLKFRKPG